MAQISYRHKVREDGRMRSHSLRCNSRSVRPMWTNPFPFGFSLIWLLINRATPRVITYRFDTLLAPRGVHSSSSSSAPNTGRLWKGLSVPETCFWLSMDYKTLNLELITEHRSDSAGLLINPTNPGWHRPSGFGNIWEETIIVLCGSCGCHRGSRVSRV